MYAIRSYYAGTLAGRAERELARIRFGIRQKLLERLGGQRRIGDKDVGLLRHERDGRKIADRVVRHFLVERGIERHADVRNNFV